MESRSQHELVAALQRDAYRIALRFGLRYRSLEAERRNVKRRYGMCDSEGNIRIRLWHTVTGRPLKYSSLIDTVCHELAHLRYFDHGPRFQAYYRRILEWARREGIYRPATRPPSDPVPATSARLRPERRRPTPGATAQGPEQLSLFG